MNLDYRPILNLEVARYKRGNICMGRVSSRAKPLEWNIDYTPRSVPILY